MATHRSLRRQTLHDNQRLVFTYEIHGDAVKPSLTATATIGKSQFGRALEYVPFIDTTVLQRRVRGPSYVFAILMDRRIRETDW